MSAADVRAIPAELMPGELEPCVASPIGKQLRVTLTRKGSDELARLLGGEAVSK